MNITNQIYQKTLEKLFNQNEYIKFLKCNSHNYKLSYRNQVLLYGQKQNAKAVLPINIWNNNFKRWVNKGTKCIYLERNGIVVRYFDISDTHPTADLDINKIPKVPIWTFDKEYENHLIQNLKNTYDINNKNDIISIIKEVINNNLQVSSDLKEFISNSVTVIVLNRLNLEYEKYINNFSYLNTIKSENQLEECLLTISNYSVDIISNIAEMVRFLDMEKEKRENDTITKNEGRNQERNRDDRNIGQEWQNNISRQERVLDTSDGNMETRSIANAENEDNRRNDVLSRRREWNIQPSDRTDRHNTETLQERNLEFEQTRISKEQLSERVRENGLEQRVGATFDTDTGRRRDEIQDIGRNNTQTNGKENSSDRLDRRELEEIGRTHQFEIRTSRTSDEGDSFSTTSNTTREIENVYGTETTGEQISLFGDFHIEKAVEDDSTAFSVPQDVINYVLCRGSGFENGKFRICNTLRENPTMKDFAKFLKKEYGIGGSSLSGEYDGYYQSHDAKGIEIRKGYADNAPQVLLKWDKVATSISQLINANKYLTETELSEYNKWLDNQSMKLLAQFDVGDKIYLDDIPFIVDEISNNNYSLRDLSIAYPIFRKETVEFVDKYAVAQKKENEISAEVNKDIQSNTENIKVAHREPLNYSIKTDEIGVGTPSERLNNNINAIRLLKTLENEHRNATADEQETLSKYVGWGGLSNVFETSHKRYDELKELLDAEEYEKARESTLTAFYTPPYVSKAIFKALENMGYKDGKILDPACGIGNFFGCIPNSLSNSKLYGVELDEISGRITRQLYQNADITISGFENTNFSDNSFDVVVGNVPFGDFKVNDSRYNAENFFIHDYFFAKSLDKVKVGGIVALITSKGTMDKLNSSVREYISQRAELIGAIRLPDNIFKNSAGTEVTSDIIFLKKRESLSFEKENWIDVIKDFTQDGQLLEVNKYFLDNPNMVLGELKLESTRFGFDVACKSNENGDTKELLNNAIQRLNGRIDIKEQQIDNKISIEYLSSIDIRKIRNYSYIFADGEIMYKGNGILEYDKVALSDKERVKGLIEIRDCVREILDIQLNSTNDNLLSQRQEYLNTIYDKFIEKYGYINNSKNIRVFKDDSSIYLLASLEKEDKEGNITGKADIFTKRTIQPHIPVTSVKNAKDGLILSVSEKAEVDIPYISKLYGQSESIVIDELQGEIFRLPQNENIFVTKDEYLSGNVREKLKQAKEKAVDDDRYNINVQALEKIQPIDLTPAEISLQLGSTWIPEEYVEQFMHGLLEMSWWEKEKIKVLYNKHIGQWYITEKSYNSSILTTETYGTSSSVK